MKPPGNETGALLHAPIPKLRLLGAYHIAEFNAKLREGPYWFWESERGRLADLIENERHGEDNER